jgi:hypothetical protein
MAHTFDTGLPKPQRTLVRAAIVARLAPLLIGAGMYMRGIKQLPRPYHGESKGDLDGLAMLKVELNGLAPSIGIALGDEDFTQDGTSADELLGDLEIFVYVVSTHNRGFIDGRLAIDVAGAASNTADPGVEVANEHVRERLAGQELAIGRTLELRLRSCKIVATYDEMTVFEQRYAISLETTINKARAATQLITELEAQHFLDTIPDGTPGVDPLVDTLSQAEP